MKPITCFVILFIVLLCVPAGAVNQYPVSRLEQDPDPHLQQGLESGLADLHLKKAAATKALSIALVDITDPSNPRHAYINPNEMMYAASLPKIAILLGAFERISNREMILDPATEATLLRMIRNSSNLAATEMLNRVGKGFIADLLQSPRYRLYDPERNGGLWVGKEYSRAVTWKRDPLHNLSHGATVLQVARFYYMLETGQLVSPAYSRQMKSILADSAIEHKFVKGLKRIHPASRIYRKSGTWRNFHADSALIEHDGRTYIAVALAESPSGGKWLTDLIVCLDNLIFDNGPAIN